MGTKPGASKLLKNLKGYNEAKQKAEENPGGDFPVVPNGNYDARVTGAEARLSKNKEAMLMISLVIIGDSEEADTKTSSFIMLEGAGASLERLIRLGYELPEDSEGIKEIINDLASSEKEVSITVKNGFATINGTLEEAHIASDDDTEEVEDEQEDEQEVETDEVLDVGDEVNFEWKGETLEGAIVSINEKEESAKIKSGNKTYPVKLEKILGKIEEQEEEEEVIEDEEELDEEPAKKPAPKKGTSVAKKPAPKPVKKVTKKK